MSQLTDNLNQIAEQDERDAQYNLGQSYTHGEGVTQDYVEAYKWWSIASANGDEVAKGDRDLISKSMTPNQIAEAQKLTREWIEVHRK